MATAAGTVAALSQDIVSSPFPIPFLIQNWHPYYFHCYFHCYFHFNTVPSFTVNTYGSYHRTLLCDIYAVGPSMGPIRMTLHTQCPTTDLRSKPAFISDGEVASN